MAGQTWMFPGQGSQRPEMAADLSACRDLFTVAESIVQADLERLCTVDPKPAWSPESLQPALFITCVGAARALGSTGARPGAVVGHSLGEYAALVAAGALEFEDGLRVVSIRAKSMALAARANPGGMAAVIGLEPGAVAEICEAVPDVWTANLNSPVQTVVSGRDPAVAEVADRALRAGAKKVVRLDVPIAGHSPLMAPAAREVEAALDQVQLKEPGCPFYSVADAAPHTDPLEIKQLLVSAITSPVRFTDTVQRMHADGFSEFIEVGPGSVLSGLVKRIVQGVRIASVSSDGEAASTGSPGKIKAGV